jgi:hypothetical protein
MINTERIATLALLIALGLGAALLGFLTGPISWDGDSYSHTLEVDPKPTLEQCEWAWDTAETEADLRENFEMGC